jgi:membrane protease YdiL (CAAX protease family)
MDDQSEVPPSTPPQSLTASFEAPPPLPPAPPPSAMRHIFFGADGLRAGWRFLLYLVMVVALGAVLGILLHFSPAKKLGLLWNLLIGESVSLVVAAVPALIMARIEHRSFGVYGIPTSRAFGKLFWIGLVWGLVALSVLLAGMHAAGAFDITALSIHGIRIWKFAAFWALFFLIVGFFEEFLMRGYTQFTLTKGIGFWPAAILLSLAFGAIHLGNKGEGVVGALAAAAIGLFFCLTLRRTGDLWFAIGFHASWDWGETYLYSVPNSGTVMPGHLLNTTFHGKPWLSGGTVGPEGSVLCFVVIALLWIVFDRLYRQAKYPAA